MTEDLPPLRADMAAVATGLRIEVKYVQNWVRRGRLKRVGKDERGRVLVDFDATEELARERGLLP